MNSLDISLPFSMYREVGEGRLINTHCHSDAMELVQVTNGRIRAQIGTEYIEAGKGDPDSDDFIYVQLEGDSMDAMARLREVYPNVMSLEVVGRDHVFEQVSDVDIERVDLVELFGEFFENRVGRPMTEKQKQIVRELMDDGEGIL